MYGGFFLEPFLNIVVLSPGADFQRTCEANPGGDNSSFIFTVRLKSVLLYHFKLAYVVLHMAVKEFFETQSKNGDIGHFNLESHF